MGMNGAKICNGSEQGPFISISGCVGYMVFVTSIQLYCWSAAAAIDCR